MDCVFCGVRLGAKRRFFREITPRPYRICSDCKHAQPHSSEFDPPAGANIGAAAIIYEKYASLRSRISLRILVWGPSTDSDVPEAAKRKEIRDVLKKAGHDVYFSEELIFDKKSLVPVNLQESIQLSEADAVVCLASDFGAIQEAQEFALRAREFLLWLSNKAKGKYTDLGLGGQLRSQGKPPVFFAPDDLESCVVDTASSEWVEVRRMQYLAADLERERLDERWPRRS